MWFASSVSTKSKKDDHHLNHGGDFWASFLSEKFRGHGKPVANHNNHAVNRQSCLFVEESYTLKVWLFLVVARV